MSYMPGMGRAMNDIFEASAENESLDLPKGEFTAKNCKAFNISLVIVSVLAIIGGLLLFLLNEEIAFLLLGLGVCLAFVLPSMLSYKCIVN